MIISRVEFPAIRNRIEELKKHVREQLADRGYGVNECMYIKLRLEEAGFCGQNIRLTIGTYAILGHNPKMYYEPKRGFDSTRIVDLTVEFIEKYKTTLEKLKRDNEYKSLLRQFIEKARESKPPFGVDSGSYGDRLEITFPCVSIELLSQILETIQHDLETYASGDDREMIDNYQTHRHE